jgi:phosphoribosylamine--glycine ligase
MVNILLIGNGAREHAIAEAITNSPQKPKLFSYMKANNPGIARLSEQKQIGKYDDLEEIENFAKSAGINFAVVGPEAPLIGIPSVGPKKQLAKLETSKSFTRLLMKKYNIKGSPKFKVFESIEGVMGFLEELEPNIVIKPDGLTGGKGVKVQGDHFETIEEAYKYCEEVLKEHKAVVVEEKLIGEEFSLQSFTDGKSLFDCPPVQDHKRAFVDDKGSLC